MRSKLLPAAGGAIAFLAAFTAGLLLGRQTAVPAPARERDDLALKEALISHILSALSGDAEELAFGVKRREFFIEGIDRRQGARAMASLLKQNTGKGSIKAKRLNAALDTKYLNPGPQGVRTMKTLGKQGVPKLQPPETGGFSVPKPRKSL